MSRVIPIFLALALPLLGALGAAACPPQPTGRCLLPGKSSVSVTTPKKAGREKLSWKWSKGAATTLADFGSPTTSTDYEVCVYAGARGRLLVDVAIPADATRWKATRKGFKYGDRTGSQGGIRKIVLQEGDAGKAKLKVTGVGVDLGADPLPSELPLRVQLVNTESDGCWEDGYGGAEIRRNQPPKLRAKGVPEDPSAPLAVLRKAEPLPRMTAVEAGVPDLFGGPVSARPITAVVVPDHPFLDNDGDARIHNDVYNTAVYNRPGPLGMNPSVTTVDLLADVVEPRANVCATLAFHEGYVLGSCIRANLNPFAGSTMLVMLDPTTLDVLAETEAAPRVPIQNSSGGAYFSVDQSGNLIIGPANNAVETWAIETHGGQAYFVLRESFDVSGELPQYSLLQDTVVDWQGRQWFLASTGQIGYVEPDTGAVRSIDLGEGLQNSMAVDETGIYVVTFEALYKFSVDDGDGSIVQEWRAPYDAGTQQLQSPGSGTTPTLFGSQDDLIGICDNADTKVNLFIRDRTTGAEVCTVPLFRPDESATENTLVGFGDEVAVVNNAGYLGAFERQYVVRPGIEKHRVRGDRSGCDLVWSNPTSIGNSAQLSTSTGLIYGWAADPNEPALDAYYFTANDWETGDEVYRIYAGNDVAFNPANGQPHLHPNGAAYVGALQGIIRISDEP